MASPLDHTRANRLAAAADAAIAAWIVAGAVLARDLGGLARLSVTLQGLGKALSSGEGTGRR